MRRFILGHSDISIVEVGCSVRMNFLTGCRGIRRSRHGGPICTSSRMHGVAFLSGTRGESRRPITHDLHISTAHEKLS